MPLWWKKGETVKHTKYMAHTAAITANVFFALNIPASKLLLSSWMTPLGLTTTTMIFSCTIFWIVSFFQKREKVEYRDLVMILPCGLLGLVITSVLFSLGVHFTTPATFSLFGALSPIVVLTLSALFLKESITRKKGIGVLLGISGASVIILQNSGSSSSTNTPFGIVITMVSVVTYATYIILVKKMSAKYKPVTLLKWMYLISFIAILPFGLPELLKQRIYSPDVLPIAIFELGFSLVFPSILAPLLLTVSLKKVLASNVSIYFNLQPIVASTVSIIIGQDVLSLEKPIALLLVIVGVLFVTQNIDKPRTLVPVISESKNTNEETPLPTMMNCHGMSE
jgi:drug/metabolite transporter (DMT)-like permease